MAKGDELQERLIEFAVSIIKLCALLPNNQVGNLICGQLLRCGTSPAPNYAEARGAESKKDFIHKMGIVLKELKESHVWLEIIKRCNLVKSKAFLGAILQECEELTKIIGSSIATAKQTRK